MTNVSVIFYVWFLEVSSVFTQLLSTAVSTHLRTYTTASFHLGKFGDDRYSSFVVKIKYSAEVRPNFGTRSACAPKYLASAEHCKGHVRCISSNHVTFAKLYTRPNPSAWLRLFIVGQLQPQRVMTDEFGMTAVCRSGLASHEYMRKTGALCNLTPSQLPIHRSTSQGPPPNHSHVAWYLLSCSIHALSASFEYSTSLKIWNSDIEK